MKAKADRKASGLCRDCPRPAKGTRCATCAKAQKDRVKAQGKCQSCGGKKDTPAVTCARCILRGVARKSLGDVSRWQEIGLLFACQDGRCAVTGAEITIGVNASLDHILPRNRGGTHEIDNLRWVHVVFNRMKNDMLDAELLGWARAIVTNAGRLDGAPSAPVERLRSWPRNANAA